MAVDVHFCQGKFKRANIFGKAKTCAEVSACATKCGKKMSSCSANSSCSADGEHKGCCENEAFLLDFDYDAAETLAPALTDISIKFITAFINTYVNDAVLPYSLHHLNYLNYHPPPLDKDIPVLFQTFLL